MEKTYGGIILSCKSDVIYGEPMGSVVIREGKGTKQRETLMGKTQSIEIEVVANKNHE